MKRQLLASLPLFVILNACGATVPPKDLVAARETYTRAEAGPAGALEPAELHTAKTAIDEADASMKEEGESAPKTLDLSYVALRKAEHAEALGQFAAERKRKAEAEATLGKVQKEYIAKTEMELGKTKGELGKTKDDLGKTKGELGKTKEDLGKVSGDLSKTKEDLTAEKKKLEEEKAARLAAEKKAQEAKDALAKIMAVKEEARGTVITLSGSVLFASGEYKLPALGAGVTQPRRRRLEEHGGAHVRHRGPHRQRRQGHREPRALEEARRGRSRLPDRSRRFGRHDQGDRQGLRGSGGRRQNRQGKANNRRVEIIVQPEGKK